MPEPNRTSGVYARRHGDYLYDVEIDEAPAGQSRRFYAKAVNILRLAPGQPVLVTPELPEESGSTFDAARKLKPTADKRRRVCRRLPASKRVSVFEQTRRSCSKRVATAPRIRAMEVSPSATTAGLPCLGCGIPR
jgi:hypothetical protein